MGAAARRAAARRAVVAVAAALPSPTATSLASGASSILGQRAASLPRASAAVSAATATPLAAGASPATFILGQRAASLPRAAFSIPAEIRPAAAPLILPGANTTTTNQVAAIRSTPMSFAANLHATRSHSTSILGNRGSLSSPIYLAHTGSLLARRGMATEALAPEVKEALRLMEEANAARQQKLVEQLNKFELDMMAMYSAGRLSSGETAFSAGKVAWRVSSAVGAFGVATLLSVLQTVKDGWKADFQREVKLMLEGMMDKMMAQLMSEVPDLVKRELLVIKAEEIVAKK